MSKAAQLERQMPASKDAEVATLGAILLDPTGSVYNQAVSGLVPDDFALDSHRKIFMRMVETFEAGEPIDLVTLTDRLSKHRELESVGGVPYVSGLTDGIPRIKNISQYIRMLKDSSSLRKIIHMANGAAEAAYEQSAPASHVLGTLQEQILSILGDEHKGTTSRISDFSDDTWKRLLERRDSPNRLIGFTTGIDAIDYRTKGIRRKEFWTIGGRTGDGKTALALQIAAANASEGIPVAYFSIEMDKDALLERLWSSWARVDYDHVIDPKRLSEVESVALAHGKDEVHSWPLFIEDSDSYTIQEIEARSRLLVRQQKVGMVIVDYLQIVDATGKDERHQLTKISKAMRRLAKSENIAVIGLSQMPRPKDQNMNKRPTKYDLKESGSLENDSNAVIVIFRPVDEYNQYTGQDELIVAKKRSGRTGIEPTVFIGKYQRFEAREL